MVMMSILALCALFLQLVVADFAFEDMESSYSATEGISLKWKLDDNDPSTSELKSPKLLLCTGPNSNFDCFTTLEDGFDLSAKKLLLPLTTASTLAANGNYFLQFYASTADGGSSTHYSDRFKLTGMTGAKAASGSGDPPTDDVEGGGNPSTLAGVTYTKQTGKTRLAPMQTQPGTKVTRALKATRRYATSAVTYYSTPRKSAAQQQTTLTPSWSYTFSAETNYASPKPQPTKYYAASEALHLSSFAQSGKAGRPTSASA